MCGQTLKDTSLVIGAVLGDTMKCSSGCTPVAEARPESENSEAPTTTHKAIQGRAP
jgi:hypothetical protein